MKPVLAQAVVYLPPDNLAVSLQIILLPFLKLACKSHHEYGHKDQTQVVTQCKPCLRHSTE